MALGWWGLCLPPDTHTGLPTEWSSREARSLASQGAMSHVLGEDAQGQIASPIGTLPTMTPT